MANYDKFEGRRLPVGRVFSFHQNRVTPFSQIDLDGHDPYLSLSTMDITLNPAVLVIRGVGPDGNEYEITVGRLKTTGPDNGLVILSTQRIDDRLDASIVSRALVGHETHRILVDCELEPDPDWTYTIRKRDRES